MAEPPSLWAPWRIDYLRDLTAGGDAPHAEAPKPLARGNGCFLCDAGREDLSEEEAVERLVLRRTAHGTLLLNRFPYSNGHLLVAPHEHEAELSDLSSQSRAGLMELIAFGTEVLKDAVHAQGVNVGLNMNRAAGAGVPGHLHWHLVPRWHGDINFMQTCAGVRVIPEALQQSYLRLKDAVDRLD